ncbi:MAG: peptidase M17 [Bacteroidales bacterium]|nr:peptidase M17 [Bacteroidales bacterium]
MQTIIHISEETGPGFSVVYMTADLKKLPASVFSAHELDYLRKRFRDDKKDLVSLNRLDHWVFVHLLGKDKRLNDRLEACRKAGRQVAGIINEHRVNDLSLMSTGDHSAELMAFAEGLSLGNYQFIKYKKEAADRIHTLTDIYLVSESLTEEQAGLVNITVDATCRCRNLVNEPVNYLNAQAFAAEMEKMGRKAGFRTEVMNKRKIEALKMGGLLAVNRGSLDPPTFTVMEWKPEEPVNDRPYVLVGKGIVFDTGGMNIKTGEYMNNMKCDMAGGAAVAAAIYATAMARLPVHVVGLVPATDNRPDGNAYVSGDVITMFDGTRVEVINTDAEGRMVLADALSYAKKFNPILVISIATLTGSAARAIGKYGMVGMQHRAGREFSALRNSGDFVCERIVEFPLWDEYAALIKSEVADIRNIGGPDAGAITAAKFLQHFTDYPFIHLDIAGPAFVEKGDDYRGTGGTGVGVRLLFDFLSKKK